MDYNSTTPLAPEALESMLPYFSARFGNPASKHHFGTEALAAVELARKQVSAVIKCSEDEIIFTSGATESNNLAVKGVVEQNYREGVNIVASAIEHTSVLDTVRSLEKSGVEVRYIMPDAQGIIHPDAVDSAIDSKTVLVSIMTANNEIGTIQPVPEIGEICMKKDVLFHTDAVQAFGKMPMDAEEFKSDLMSISAHKIYGPKGIGALYVSRRAKKRIAAQITGGGHEQGLRSGTLNVPAIVGFGKAAEIAGKRLFDDFQKQIVLRDILIQNLLTRVPFSSLNGSREKRLPNNANISFEGVDSSRLISNLKTIALSTGSACSSATLQPSYVLKAIGKSETMIKSAVRFGIGRETTEEEVKIVIERVIEEVNKLRN